MPHPALVPFLDSGVSPLSREEFDSWLEEWQRLPNTGYADATDYMSISRPPTCC